MDLHLDVECEKYEGSKKYGKEKLAGGGVQQLLAPKQPTMVRREATKPSNGAKPIAPLVLQPSAPVALSRAAASLSKGKPVDDRGGAAKGGGTVGAKRKVEALGEKSDFKTASAIHQRGSKWQASGGTATSPSAMVDMVEPPKPWSTLAKAREANGASREVKLLMTGLEATIRPKKKQKDKVLTLVIKVDDGLTQASALCTEELVLETLGLSRKEFLHIWNNDKKAFMPYWNKLQKIVVFWEGIFEVRSTAAGDTHEPPYTFTMHKFREVSERETKMLTRHVKWRLGQPKEAPCVIDITDGD